MADVQTPSRYKTLDAWRGAAALAVVLFHCSNTIVTRESATGRALLAGWAGVFLFFPISGYCILGAVDGHADRTVGQFLVRRWRRIVPPYWASVVLALAIALAALPFNGGSAGDLLLPAHAWIAIATLTQGFTSHSGAINPVYWSLGYEEQFYLVMALLLCAPARMRSVTLTALTVGAAVYAAPHQPWMVRGLFLDYWMCFSAGCAAYVWLHRPTERRYAGATLCVAMAWAAAYGNLAVGLSVATAVALIALAPFDECLAAALPVRMLSGIGVFSYSLYLVHVPIGGRVTNLLGRTSLPPAIIVPAAVAASIAGGWVFWTLVERRAMPAARTSTAPRVRAGRWARAGADAASWTRIRDGLTPARGSAADTR